MMFWVLNLLVLTLITLQIINNRINGREAIFFSWFDLQRVSLLSLSLACGLNLRTKKGVNPSRSTPVLAFDQLLDFMPDDCSRIQSEHAKPQKSIRGKQPKKYGFYVHGVNL